MLEIVPLLLNCTPKTRQFPAPVTLGKSTVSTLIGYLSIPLAMCCTKVGTPGSGVPVGEGVAVAVAVALGDGVVIGVTVAVAVGVGVAFGVAVAVGVAVGVAVAIGVAVAAGVGVAVAIGVAVGVTVGVGAGGGVGLSLGVGLGLGVGCVRSPCACTGTANIQKEASTNGMRKEPYRKTEPRAEHLLRVILVSNVTR
jgi:hypothetical protein